MPLDVVLAGSGLEDDFLDRAREVDVGGTTARVIDLGDLIIAKVLAGRPKDLEDVTSLWRRQEGQSRINHDPTSRIAPEASTTSSQNSQWTMVPSMSPPHSSLLGAPVRPEGSTDPGIRHCGR